MKNIIWIFTVGFLLQDVFCIDILSKLHQNGYKLKDIRIQLMRCNKKYFNFYEIKPFKYNRTTTAHNITLNTKITIKDDSEVVVQGNKFLSNEYRHFPMRFQINLKKAYDSNAIGMREMRKCGNCTFYFEKDVTYHICNFIVDEKHFPPLIPTSRYRFDMTMLYFNEETALLALFAEVYTPIPYPKK